MRLPIFVLIATMLVMYSFAGRSQSEAPREAVDDHGVVLKGLGLRVQAGTSERKTCNAYYEGHSKALAEAHNCTDTGQSSACGGPDQCSCPSDQRLVGFKCDEGTFNVCTAKFADGTPRCR